MSRPTGAKLVYASARFPTEHAVQLTTPVLLGQGKTDSTAKINRVSMSVCAFFGAYTFTIRVRRA